MKNNKEIEVKLSYEDRNKLTKKLILLGAKKEKTVTLHDSYFGQPGSNMNNSNELTRIRTKDSESELTYKGQCKDKNNVWERTEITVRIKDAGQMKQILQKIGLTQLSENESKREAWKLGKCEILFIDFLKPEKISMLEIEGPSEKDVQKSILQLGSLVQKIGEEAFTKFDKSRKK